MKYATILLSFFAASLTLLPLTASAHGRLAPIIDDNNMVAAKGDIQTPRKYEPAIHAYLTDVETQLKLLQDHVEQIVNDSQAGHLQAAQNAYVKAHQDYERVRPMMILFGNVNETINSRADYYLQGVDDPRFVGFHLVEYDLFSLKDSRKAHDDAIDLRHEVKDLRKRMAVETIDIAKMAQAAADLMETVLQTKLQGKENQYSHSDLADIAANIEGSQLVIKHLRPFIAPNELSSLERGFAQINAILKRYQLPNQEYQVFRQLSPADHAALYSLITNQADQLSRLRAELNVDVYYKYRH